VASINDRCGDQRGEQVLDLVAGQLDRLWRRWVLGVLGDRATTRNAHAGMARVTHRYQERQRRT
jgi:hypothetical protein